MDKVRTVELRMGPLGRESAEVVMSVDIIVGRDTVNTALVVYIDWPSIIRYGAPPEQTITVSPDKYIAMYINDELQWWAADGEIFEETDPHKHGWQVMVKEHGGLGIVGKDEFLYTPVKYGEGDFYIKP